MPEDPHRRADSPPATLNGSSHTLASSPQHVLNSLSSSATIRRFVKGVRDHANGGAISSSAPTLTKESLISIHSPSSLMASSLPSSSSTASSSSSLSSGLTSPFPPSSTSSHKYDGGRRHSWARAVWRLLWRLLVLAASSLTFLVVLRLVLRRLDIWSGPDGHEHPAGARIVHAAKSSGWLSQFTRANAGGAHGGAGGDTSLVVLMPFIADDLPHILQGMKHWAELGPVCDPSQSLHLGLRFYFSRTRAEYDAQGLPYLENMMQPEAAIMANVAACFESVETIFADLTLAEDGYPEGPSNMFFKLLIHQAASLLAPFTHLYWMEWDVKPVRPYWVEKLYDLTLHDEFWMKGGRYRGRAFDEVVKDSSSWGWVGHLNGNAVYKLHDPVFLSFLQLTVEREPPSHFWKPFDIAMWRTLCDFPYSWHFYQSYGDKFQTTTAIQHHGFTGTDEEFADVVAHQPNVFLIHGDSRSAGQSKYLKKFKDGVPQTNGTIAWLDEVSPAMRVSIMLRTYKSDFPFASLALQSAQRYFPGALELVVVVPEEDAQAARQQLPSNIVLYAEARQLHNDHIQQKLTKLLAERYCQGDYIFHLDSDVVFHRPVLRRDLFIFDKPIITFDRYDNVEAIEYRHVQQLIEAGHVNASVTIRRWQQGTAFALGQQVDFDFRRSNDHIYHRRVYADARAHIERIHGMTLAAFLDTREGKVHFSDSGEAVTDLTRLFSDFNYLGAYQYYHRPESMSWTYLGTDAPPPYALPYAYTSIRPDLLCQGNSRLHRGGGPHNENLLNAQLAILQRIVGGASRGCHEIKGFIASQAFT